jgi:hypothetical protein
MQLKGDHRRRRRPVYFASLSLQTTKNKKRQPQLKEEAPVNVKEIRDKARALGVKNYSKLRKADLIKSIQVQEGNAPCYQEITGCQQHDCCWMGDCQV